MLENRLLVKTTEHFCTPMTKDVEALKMHACVCDLLYKTWMTSQMFSEH